MLVAVRAEVENVERWREGFKTHGDLFSKQKISIAYLGATDDNKVIAVVDTSDMFAATIATSLFAVVMVLPIALPCVVQ